MDEIKEINSGRPDSDIAVDCEADLDGKAILTGPLCINISSIKEQEGSYEKKKRKITKGIGQIPVDDDDKNDKMDVTSKHNVQCDDFIVDDGSSDFDEDDIIRVEGGIKSSDDEYDEKVSGNYIDNKSNVNKNLSGRKLSETEIRSEIRQFIQLMKDAARKDEVAYSDGKVAISKLKMVDEVCRRVSLNNLSGYFISEGVLDVLSLWLSPFNDGTLPNLSIRTKILKLISSIPLGEEDITSTELGKILCKLWKNSAETIENRQIIRTLIQRWVRLISKPIPSSSLDTLIKTPVANDKLNSQNNVNIESKKNSLYVEPRTARVPITTGYNFKVIPHNDSSSIEDSTSTYTDKSIGGINITKSSRNRNRSKHAMKISLEGRGL